MDFRKFGRYLLTIATLLLLVAGGLVWQWKESPPSHSKEIHALVIKLANGQGTLADRMTVDAARAQDRVFPEAARTALIAAAVVGVLAVGLLVSTKPAAGQE